MQGDKFVTVGAFDSTGLSQWADMKDNAGTTSYAKDATSTAPSTDYTPEACSNFTFIKTEKTPGFPAWLALLSIFALIPIMKKRKN